MQCPMTSTLSFMRVQDNVRSYRPSLCCRTPSRKARLVLSSHVARTVISLIVLLSIGTTTPSQCEELGMRTKACKTSSQIAISADSGEPLGGKSFVFSSCCTCLVLPDSLCFSYNTRLNGEQRSPIIRVAADFLQFNYRCIFVAFEPRTFKSRPPGMARSPDAVLREKSWCVTCTEYDFGADTTNNWFHRDAFGHFGHFGRSGVRPHSKLGQTKQASASSLVVIPTY